MSGSESSRMSLGNSRFGGKRWQLVIGACIAGAAFSTLLWWLVATLLPTDRPLWVWLVCIAVTFPIASLGTWAALVDQSTLVKAIRHPKSSVEYVWHSQAAAGAFTDALLLLPVGILVFFVADLQVNSTLLLLIVFLALLTDFTIRKLAAKRVLS